MIEKKQIYSSYKSQNKWLGIIDYKSLMVIIIYIILIFLFIKNLNFSFTASLYIFTLLVSPIVIIFCLNTKNGSAIDILIVIIMFLIKKKIFIDLKDVTNKKGYVYKKLD